MVEEDVKFWANTAKFTEKEMQIFVNLCSPLDYDEIAELHGMAKKTLKFHMLNIYQKLGFHEAFGKHTHKRIKLFKVFCDITLKKAENNGNNAG